MFVHTCLDTNPHIPDPFLMPLRVNRASICLVGFTCVESISRCVTHLGEHKSFSSLIVCDHAFFTEKTKVNTAEFSIAPKMPPVDG